MTTEQLTEETLHPADHRNAARVARHLTKPGITPGDIAKLKRMNPNHPTEKVFWETCIDLGIDQAGEGLTTTWARISGMIAKGTKVTEERADGPHDGNIPLGKALATAGYSESRLKALLNAEGTSVIETLERAVAFLYSKTQKFNWNDAARLALTGHRTQASREADRMRIARDYYRETHSQLENQKT
ncbi:MAG: type I-E CRISPR-associated protein Cse2/CasB [Chloroflexota bacterium]|nr:type I-E CRISPR-associated protein Cse2/CasB [Chloroflexota bacterium]